MSMGNAYDRAYWLNQRMHVPVIVLEAMVQHQSGRDGFSSSEDAAKSIMAKLFPNYKEE